MELSIELLNMLAVTLLVVVTGTFLIFFNLWSWVLFATSFSAVIIIFYSILGAVDVAITEISVGLGCSTLIVFSALRILGVLNIKEKIFKLIPFLSITSLFLVWVSLSLPLFGDIHAPAYWTTVPHYLTQSYTETEIPNIVTSVLASYRGYDSFGESFVLFTSILAPIALLKNKKYLADSKETQAVETIQLTTNTIMRGSSGIFSIITLFGAFYIQFFGDYGPGGGFQGGVLSAIAIILHLVRVEKANTTYHNQIEKYTNRALFAGLICLLFDVAIGPILQEPLLSYSIFSHSPAHGQEIGIFIFEVGVGLVVFGSTLLGFISLHKCKSNISIADIEPATETQEQ